MTVKDVKISSGIVRGQSSDGIDRFFGIPYAAAPVGPLRFAAPLAHPGWDGVRDASRVGPNAPHRLKAFPGLDVAPLIGTGWREGDDYLNLNIWAPASGDKLPVMIFVHGGGFVVGSNHATVQDGSAFARDGVICVAINYRMGVDGFLPIPGVPTNLGLRDILFACRWVQDNIAAFGGDPANVTIFGESAGAMAIADLITSPLAKGLFKRAIVQSGHGNMTRDLDVAQRLVKKLAKLLGVTPDEQGFRSTSFAACADAVAQASLPTTRLDLRDKDGREPVFGISRFVPVHDDDVLPDRPLEALKKGAGREIDLLIGSNAEEMNLYLVPTGVREKVGKVLSWLVLSRSQPKALRTLRAYAQAGKTPGQALTDAMTDLVFRWPARRFAEEHRGRTHMYELDWGSSAFGGTLGACHGMELPFVFDTLASVTGPQGLAGEDPPQELATRTHRIWVDYARNGTLPWGEFQRDTRLVYQLGKGEAVNEPVMPAAPYSP